MRSLHNFNQGWLYAPRELALSAPDSDFEPVTLPHGGRLLPHHNFDVADYAIISTYRKRFTLPEAREGRRVFIDFDGVMISSQVWINGHYLGEYDGGFTPFSYDLTPHLREGENVVQVRVDSTERPDIPPFGFVVDYLTFSGIYRDVTLRLVDPVYIDDVFVKPTDVLSDAVSLVCDVSVTNTSPGTFEGKVLVAFPTDVLDFEHVEAVEPVRLDAGEKRVVTVRLALGSRPKLWSLEAPVLYGVHVELERPDGREIDHQRVRIGFRHAEFRPDGFYLNGDKLKLRGLNRHQIYPYIGAAAPARLQRKDADILKDELGVNIVRTSHYPQSPHFISRCDEIGLLVMEEIPGWQNIGDSDWKALSLRDVQAMIERDRNHPSIILWGVRINESWDDGAFYKATNELAHRLDPTRQTGGVRNFQGSQFLEDVYTFNDFSNGIEAPQQTPHLVTEFSGHMFPTKTWDQDERQIEHAIRHARIQDAAAGRDDVTGAIGWCMFDYNTHLEFGSGDRICYHGVLDPWRLPKYAAYFYESQISPTLRPVLRLASNYAFGDRSDGGAEQPGAITLFSNCDEVEWILGGESQGRFTPDRASFPHLPHPPFRFGDPRVWYNSALRVPSSCFVGYVGGQRVIELEVSQDRTPQALTLTADDAELTADGADMTRLVFKVVDAHGHRLPYSLSVVSFTVEGEAELVGVNPFPLAGGQAAVYLKARHTPGTVTVRAEAQPWGLKAEAQVTLR